MVECATCGSPLGRNADSCPNCGEPNWVRVAVEKDLEGRGCVIISAISLIIAAVCLVGNDCVISGIFLGILGILALGFGLFLREPKQKKPDQ